MYKMLVIDLDGTLLDDYKEIPEKNIKAIKRLHDEFGIIPVIATARPLGVAKYIADKGGDAFQSYIIATNGAILMDLKNNNLLINKSLQQNQIKELIDTCKKNNLEYEFMTTECEVADAKYSYRRVVDPMYDNMGVLFNFQIDLESYIESLQKPIPLFSINGTDEELAKCFNEISNIKDIQISGKCTRTTPQRDESGKIQTLSYYDIMRKGVTKASAIQTLAEHLRIRKEEIIAIGDGGNDIEMLDCAGLKIVMKNAKDSLKHMADIITPVDNNAGGVGLTIDAICNSLINRKKRDEKYLLDHPLDRD